MEVNLKDELEDALFSDFHECFENMSIASNFCKERFKENLDAWDSSDLASGKEDSLLVDFIQIDSCNSSDSFMCLRKSEQFLNNFEFKMSNAPGSYCKKTEEDLNSYTLKQLQDIIEDLTQSVEQISSELVQLLLENDALQQESDARNIAIEQLLKMTVKINENDLKPIQMSIIHPDNDCGVI